MSKANHKNEERSENFCNYSNENKKTEEKCEDDSTNETSSPYSDVSQHLDQAEIDEILLKCLTISDTEKPWPESSMNEEDHALHTRKDRNTSCITKGYHTAQEIINKVIRTSVFTIRGPYQIAQKSTTCFSNPQTKQTSVTDQEYTLTSIKAGSEDDLLMGKQTLQTQPTLASATDWIGCTENCLAVPPRPAIVETSVQDDKHAIDTEKEIDTSHITKGDWHYDYGKLPRTITSNQKPPYSKQEGIGDLSTGGNICVKRKCYFKTKNRSMLMKILFAFILAPTGAQLQGNSSLINHPVPVCIQATIYCIFEKDIDFSQVEHISLQHINASGSVPVVRYFGSDDSRNFIRPGYAVDYNKTNSTILAISRNATSEKHEGTYECQANNNKHNATVKSDEQYALMLSHLLATGRGRHPDIPAIPCTNRLIAQLSLLRLDGKKTLEDITNLQ